MHDCINHSNTRHISPWIAAFHGCFHGLACLFEDLRNAARQGIADGVKDRQKIHKILRGEERQSIDMKRHQHDDERYQTGQLPERPTNPETLI